MCDAIPRLDARTEVVVLMHVREYEKPTNTGRLVPWMLPNASILLRGTPDDIPVPDDDTRPTFVLHPDAERELRREDALANPRLLFPDGTWAQARRMLGRDPALAGATRVRLPPGGPGIYALRKDVRPLHLSTLEAVARSVGVLEGEPYERAMTDVLAMLVERMLLTRGVLRLDPVHGIVPAGPYVPPPALSEP